MTLSDLCLERSSGFLGQQRIQGARLEGVVDSGVGGSSFSEAKIEVQP